jgi:hypothetical protein
VKETLKQGQEKKRKTKHKFSIWEAIGRFAESTLVRQGFSKRIAKKVVWGEGGKR